MRAARCRSPTRDSPTRKSRKRFRRRDRARREAGIHASKPNANDIRTRRAMFDIIRKSPFTLILAVTLLCGTNVAGFAVAADAPAALAVDASPAITVDASPAITVDASPAITA